MYIMSIYKMEPDDLLRQCTGFQWDDGNAPKIWNKHRVSTGEAEQVFFNHPLVVGEDAKHAHSEVRFYALGETDARRRLFVVLTVRENQIRVISARDMSRKERKVYDTS